MDDPNEPDFIVVTDQNLTEAVEKTGHTREHLLELLEVAVSQHSFRRVKLPIENRNP